MGTNETVERSIVSSSSSATNPVAKLDKRGGLTTTDWTEIGIVLLVATSCCGWGIVRYVLGRKSAKNAMTHCCACCGCPSRNGKNNNNKWIGSDKNDGYSGPTTRSASSSQSSSFLNFFFGFFRRSDDKNCGSHESYEKQVTIPYDKSKVLEMRRNYFANSLSISYANSDPLMIMKGQGSYLVDETGVRYLDSRNNVAHCGHGHPQVVRAVQQQVAQLNTNTRYLHPNMVELAHRLIQKMPPPLSKVFFCNSGSEANDLALRLARAYSGGSNNTIVLQGAYHGHTLAVLEISPYKFLKGTEYQHQLVPRQDSIVQDEDGEQSSLSPKQSSLTPGPHIWSVPMPDTYRGEHRDVNTAGEEYAKYVERACAHYQNRSEKVRAIVMEGGLSVGGVILPPRRYVSRAVAAVRAAGGLYIADEVQTGFGRLGSCFWAFEYHHSQRGGGGGDGDDTVDDDDDEMTIPDIVTMGKPMGNGMPLAAVVCTASVAEALDRCQVEYFNTFGGNPVCAAAGLAVLNVLEQEGLQQHARRMGDYFQDKFRLAMERIPLIGNVRGSGLFWGMEFVKNRETLEPATVETYLLCSIMRLKYHILTSIDGPNDNVFVIKPPMVFGEKEADIFFDALETACLVDLPLELQRGEPTTSRTPT